MRKYGVIIIAIVILAGGATYARYGNFDPCDWTAQDHANTSAIPKLVWAGRLQADFLVDGITEPNFGDCMLAWWQNRAAEARQ